MSNDKFGLLRKVLSMIGLSAEAVDELVARVAELLSGADKKNGAPEFPYFAREHFLSAAELSFYRVLLGAVNDWAVVFPKVSLQDLIYANHRDQALYVTYTNKINRKHVDFLLCDRKTLKPIVAVELDDKSHMRNDRVRRDEFVQQVFAAAGLPLVRIVAKRAYSPTELNALLMPSGQQLHSDVHQLTSKASMPGKVIPQCPDCNSPMVLRTAKRGSAQGKQFWGCPNYPRCRGMRQYESESTSLES